MRVSTSSATKSVRFSPISRLQYINYPSAKDILAIWYSTEDIKRFRHVMMRDVMVCSFVLTDANDIQDQLISKDYLIRCVGLDHLISRDVPQRYQAIMAARKEHARIVLEEQKWQKNNDVNCPENLARVSKTSSQWSCERSHKLAKVVGLI